MGKKVLVAGALEQYEGKALEFISYLGEMIMQKGHTLVNGCSNEFDRLIAKSAYEYLVNSEGDPRSRILCYAKSNSEPVHNYGTILRSELETWGLEHATLFTPEPIADADVVIIIGGKEGTLCAANWARIANKPLLPVTAFDGAGKTLYSEELKEFERKYADTLDVSRFKILNQAAINVKQIAEDVVSLAASINISRHVLVLMSFAQEPELEDAYESFQTVCKEFGYDCTRIDDSNAIDRIVPEIFSGIKRAAFIICDLTQERANVYYELGYAHGLRKPVVITARNETQLPFDVKDIPAIFWCGQKQLKEKLKEKITKIAEGQGRS